MCVGRADVRRNVCIAANTTWYVCNFRSRLITEMRKQGYSVSVLSPPDSYVSRIEALGVTHVPLFMDNAGINPWRELTTLRRMYTTLKRIKPDVVLTYTPKINIYVSLVARVLRLPVIANISGLGRAFVAGGRLKAIVKSLYRLALAHPELIFFQNEDDRTDFVRAKLVQPSRTARLPGSGVDVDRFRPPAKVGGGDRFVFLLAARMLWDKGVGEFVEAARLVRRQHPLAEFQLLGFLDVQNPSAISRAQIEKWEAADVVRYLGATDDVLPYLVGADCVVLPSYREGVPRILLEAAAMAKPVITTDAPGCRDVVENGANGFLCQVRDAEDLADKMMRLIRMDRSRLREMGDQGREKMVREFDERIVIRRYLEALSRIVPVW